MFIIARRIALYEYNGRNNFAALLELALYVFTFTRYTRLNFDLLSEIILFTEARS